MLLKKIDVLRCTFMLVFVVPSILISLAANARIAVADGEYFGWEESITVKSGKVISCGGVLFDNTKCKGWKFTTSSHNVVKATSKSGQVYYFCSVSSQPKSQASCEPNGWRKTPVP
jgi:Na+-transporting NADH:ubiquinone oxidoreductase subunit NqrA